MFYYIYYIRIFSYKINFFMFNYYTAKIFLIIKKSYKVNLTGKYKQMFFNFK